MLGEVQKRVLHALHGEKSMNYCRYWNYSSPRAETIFSASYFYKNFTSYSLGFLEIKYVGNFDLSILLPKITLFLNFRFFSSVYLSDENYCNFVNAENSLFVVVFCSSLTVFKM